MILVDTSVWIDFFRHDEAVFSRLKNELEKQNILAVEWIFGELLQGSRNQKESKIIVQYWENLPKIELENVWIEAGRFSSVNRFPSKGVGLFDAATIVAARKREAQIWSLDKRLLSVLKPEEIFKPLD